MDLLLSLPKIELLDSYLVVTAEFSDRPADDFLAITVLELNACCSGAFYLIVSPKLLMSLSSVTFMKSKQELYHLRTALRSFVCWGGTFMLS